MTFAFVFYTSGVWAERLARDLKPWHLAAFWFGWAFDACGTWMMELLRIGGREAGLLHGITGAAAFLLMGAHALWATLVLWKGGPEKRRTFHRYSLGVWLVWLIPYLGGMIAGVATGLS